MGIKSHRRDRANPRQCLYQNNNLWVTWGLKLNRLRNWDLRGVYFGMVGPFSTLNAEYAPVPYLRDQVRNVAIFEECCQVSREQGILTVIQAWAPNRKRPTIQSNPYRGSSAMRGSAHVPAKNGKAGHPKKHPYTRIHNLPKALYFLNPSMYPYIILATPLKRTPSNSAGLLVSSKGPEQSWPPQLLSCVQTTA